MKSVLKAVCALASLAAALNAGEPEIKPDDFRNVYGIAWRGTADENLDFARQMGYTHVFYQWGMERNPKAKGFKFFIESPEYAVYPRVIDTTKKYSPEQIKWWETNCSLLSLDKPFPWNIAPGWRSGKGFTATLDLQQKRVIREITDKIIERVKKIEEQTPGFKFAGFAWDVPQPAGDFWDGTKDDWFANGRQVTLAHWTGKDSGIRHPDTVHDYPTYSRGHMEFYRHLFERARAELNKDAKFIVEPSGPYDQWVKFFEFPPYSEMRPEERKKYEADLVAVESASTDFVTDRRLFAKGTVKPSQMCSSTPNAFEEPVSREIAGLAAANGAWTAFFGMPEGNGHTPGFRSISQMPARLKLVKAIPVWENILNVPLEKRKWDGKTYESPDFLRSLLGTPARDGQAVFRVPFGGRKGENSGGVRGGPDISRRRPVQGDTPALRQSKELVPAHSPGRADDENRELRNNADSLIHNKQRLYNAPEKEGEIGCR